MSGKNKRKRHTPKQVIVKQREIDADLGAGVSIQEIARKHVVSEMEWHGRLFRGSSPGLDCHELRGFGRAWP